MTHGRMAPVHADPDSAPQYSIKLVSRECKGDCSKSCGCRSIHLQCKVTDSDCMGGCGNGDEMGGESNL